MHAGAPEAEALEERTECTSGGVVHGKLEEGESGQRRRGRRVEERDASGEGCRGICCAPGSPGEQPLPHLALEIKQRAHRVDRSAAIWSLAKDVVEDLERQRAGIARTQHLLEKIRDVELALAGEIPEVASPLQRVHRQERRVGQLHEEYLVSRDVCDAGGVIPQRQRMHAVDDQAEMWVIGTPHDRPGLRVEVHAAAPGQRFEADAQAAPAGAFGEFVQLRSRTLLVRHRDRGGVGADEHQVRAQRLHQVEFSLCPIEVAPMHGVGGAFEIPEWLKQFAGKAQIGGHATDRCWRLHAIGQVVLEEFEAVEARGGNGLELFRKRAAHRHGGDRLAHGTVRRT